jgi:hypothetical protein
MSALIHCPGCRSPLAITPQMAGQLIVCPACGQQIHLAAATPPQAAYSPPGWSQPPMMIPDSPAVPAAGTADSAKETAARYSRKQTGVSLAALASWAVLGGLLLVAAALVWLMKQRQDGTAPVAAAPREILIAPPLPPRLPARSVDAERSSSAVASASLPPIPVETPVATSSRPDVQPAAVTPQISSPQTIAQMTGKASQRTASSPMPVPAIGLPPVATPSVNVAPPAAAPAGPLAGLPRAVRLPSLISSSPETLLALSLAPSEPVSISIRSLAADIPEAAAMFTEADPERRAWIAYYVSDLDTGIGRTPLGRFQLTGQDITFQWPQSIPQPELCRQLANCQAELRHGNAVHVVQLREIVQQPPLVLDLETDRQMMQLELADLPKADTLRLEIRELAAFASGGRMRGNETTLNLGGQAIIEFTDLPGAEIGVRFFRLSSASPLQLRLEPAFHEGKTKEFELTLTRLEALEKAAQENLAEDKRELPVVQKGAKDLNELLGDLRAKNPGKNIALRGPWERNVAAVNKELGRAIDKARLLVRRIAENETRLKAVPAIRDFLNGLHQKAAIRYAVVAECGEQDVVLIETR